MEGVARDCLRVLFLFSPCVIVSPAELPRRLRNLSRQWRSSPRRRDGTDSHDTETVCVSARISRCRSATAYAAESRRGCLGVCSSCLLILFFFYLRAIRKTTQSSCATRVYAIRVKRISSPIPGAPCAEALRALCSTSWHHCLLEPPAAMQYRARLSPRTLQCHGHAAAAPRRVSRPMR